MDPSDQFDDFLKGAVEKQEQREVALAHDEAVYRSLRDELKAQAVPCFTDEDPEVADRLQAQAVDDVFRLLMQQVTNPGHSQDDWESLMLQKAEAIVAKEILKEQARLEGMGIIIRAHDNDILYGNGVDMDQCTQEKRQFIADMITIDELDADGAWVMFMNRLLPGDDFDPTAAYADRYFIASLATQQQQEAESLERLEKMKELAQLICGSDREIGVDDIKGAGELMRLCLMPRNMYEREAAIRQACADRGIDPARTGIILAYLNEKFPINPLFK